MGLGAVAQMAAVGTDGIGRKAETKPAFRPMWCTGVAPYRRGMEQRSIDSRPVALVTGASQGLGRALARGLARAGWRLVIDARRPEPLAATAAELGAYTDVVAIAGDVSDEAHRQELADAVRQIGRLDAVVHNASMLGPSPQPALADYPLDVLQQVYEVNVFSPLRLTQLLLPFQPGRIAFVTSDAGVEAYEGWGGYGSSKAALEQVGAVLAAELAGRGTHVYVVDPGDMDTQMHADAFPGETFPDLPSPEVSVPGLLRLLEGDLPSGRYQARAVAAPVGAGEARG